MEARLIPTEEVREAWDVGAFEGGWTRDLLKAHPKAHVRLFEPVPGYYEAIANSWSEVSPYGLSDRDQSIDITIAGDRSSTYDMGFEGTGKVRIELRDVSKELGETRLDVMKINVEGAEYPILERLTATGQISQIKTLLIQFHTFIPHFGERYLAIKKALSRTHTLQWRDPFVWERWNLL